MIKPAEALCGLLWVWEMEKCLLYLQRAEAQVKDPKHSGGKRSMLGNFLRALGGDGFKLDSTGSVLVQIPDHLTV